LTAGPVRFRPIVMTSVAMIMGMVPAALGMGEGAEWRQVMGITVIGGLLTSTFLSLIVVPIAYILMDNLESRFKKKKLKPAV
jgi:HAE1 family hydrophobic/amphiphilic exporter-1